MLNPFVASTQFGDLKGTISIDGFQGLFISELVAKAKVPKGFVPVGLSCYLGEPSIHDESLNDRFFSFSLVAVKTNEHEISKIHAKAITDGKLDVYRFEIEGLQAEDVLKLIKRMDIKLVSRELKDIDIEEYEAP